MRAPVILFSLCLLPGIYCKISSSEFERGLDVNKEIAERTTIISYRKSKLSANDINNEYVRLKNECKCDVKHLASVGAFILTHESKSHVSPESLTLIPSKEVGVDDQVVSIDDELPPSTKVKNDRSFYFGPIYGPLGSWDSFKPPNDPFFKLKQWSLANSFNGADINSLEGWLECLSELCSRSSCGNTLYHFAPEVIVAVIDTGVDYTHEDLRNVMWRNRREIAGNGIDDDKNGIIDDFFGADFSSGVPNGNPMDKNSHGTHCAGIVAAEANNGKGIAGVAGIGNKASYLGDRNVKIMAVKGVRDDKKGTFSRMLQSLNYAIENGATISSNSWGVDVVTPKLEEMWSNVLQNNPNHLLVASAGNKNRKIDASYRRMLCGLKEPNLLCVASSNQFGEKSWFSNYGKEYVHVFAPGSSIFSTLPKNKYGLKSGSSMACPHVSGLAALVMLMRNSLSGKMVKDLIEANVQKKSSFKNFVSTGGLIDVGKTLRNVGKE